jgi:phosphatidyl-N-methylethanolamine N-methyltransferase
VIIRGTLAACVLLSIERICYVLVWRAPEVFRLWCAHPAVARVGGPVDVLQGLFVLFKLLQVAVFAVWCCAFADDALLPLPAPPAALAVGVLLIASGQALNLSVFGRLGRIGVFYGARFGHEVPWCDGFPFSYLRHPQYVGTVMTIWGLFLIARFPHDDWIVLPVVETVYYALGMRFEREPDRSEASESQIVAGNGI